MGAMLGLVLAGNLLVLFVFWEVTTIASYLLIGFKHETSAKSRRVGAAGAAGDGRGRAGACWPGSSLLGIVGGTYEIAGPGRIGEVIRAHPLVPGDLRLFIAGRASPSRRSVPFHFWLPNAMAAPTPVIAYLHCATMVKAGIYLMARMDAAARRHLGVDWT